MAMSMRTSKLPGGIMGSRPSWTASIIGGIVMVIMAFPIYWMVITALKPKREILSATPSFWM